MNIQDKLIDLRNYVVRYGNITFDSSFETHGNHWRKTVVVIESKTFTILMRNGEVNSLTC